MKNKINKIKEAIMAEDIKIIKWGENAPLEVDSEGKVIKTKKELLIDYQKDLAEAESKLEASKTRAFEASEKTFKICPITGAKIKVEIENDINSCEEEVNKIKNKIKNVDNLITEKYNQIKEGFEIVKEDILDTENRIIANGQLLVRMEHYSFDFDIIKDWRIKPGEEIDLRGYVIVEELGYEVMTKEDKEKNKLNFILYISSVIKHSSGSNKRKFSVRTVDYRNENETLAFAENYLTNVCKLTSLSKIKELAKKKFIKKVEKQIVDLVIRKVHYVNSFDRYKKVVSVMEKHIIK